MPRSHAPLLPEPLAAKVPEITVLFWVVKVLTTGMGEAASDWLGARSIALAAVVGLFGFAAALVWQLRTREYRASVYWTCVAMVAVFGTMAADGFHKLLGFPYTVTTVGYAIAVAALLAVWHRSEGTLSIHSITTSRRELFYWATVLATFALGTATGDLFAMPLHLGYFSSGLLFTGLIVLPWLGWAVLRLNAVVMFWTAYVLTRPLGASYADWLGKGRHLGGLAWGDGTVTVLSGLVIVALVVYLARTGHGVQDRAAVREPATQGASV